MAEEKVPVFVARKATKKDLGILNKKFGEFSERQFNENDLNRFIIMEANGKIVGIHSYDPTKKDFFEVTRDPLVRQIGISRAKTEIEMEKRKNEIIEQVKREGAEKFLKNFKERVRKIAREN